AERERSNSDARPRRPPVPRRLPSRPRRRPRHLLPGRDDLSHRADPEGFLGVDVFRPVAIELEQRAKQPGTLPFNAASPWAPGRVDPAETAALRGRRSTAFDEKIGARRRTADRPDRSGCLWGQEDRAAVVVGGGHVTSGPRAGEWQAGRPRRARRTSAIRP